MVQDTYRLILKIEDVREQYDDKIIQVLDKELEEIERMMDKWKKTDFKSDNYEKLNLLRDHMKNAYKKAKLLKKIIRKEEDYLKHLKKLSLNENHVKEIEGLENLKNLEMLDLSDNQIEEVKGLENLTKLENLDLRKNPIREYEWNIAFRKSFNHVVTNNAQEIVKYCQEKSKKQL